MIKPKSPGSVLWWSYLKPNNITQEQLSKETELPLSVIEGIINEEQSVTDNIAEKLSKYFGTTKNYWLDIQFRFDLWVKNTIFNELMKDKMEQLAKDAMEWYFKQ